MKKYSMEPLKIHLYALIMIFALGLMAADSPKEIPKGDVADNVCVFEYAVYIIDPSVTDTEKILKEIAGDKYKFLIRLDKPRKDISFFMVKTITDVQKEYAPPSPEALQHFGRGLSKEQAEKMQDSSSVIMIDFAFPIEKRADGMLAAAELMEKLAEKTKGIIWDEETRECFTAESWKKDRIETFDKGIPDVPRNITIHAYKNGEYIRAITLGMVKFGLPDIVVNDFPWSLNKSVGNLINAFAQQLYETGTIVKKGEFDLDLQGIKHDGARKRYLNGLYDNSTKKASLGLVEGKLEEGDPENRLFEIVFDKYKGKDKIEKMEDMTTKLWGSEDSISYVKHNDEILAASKKAKEKIPAIQEAFSKGLAPGEYYMVKSPFLTPDKGTEWMWVEIVSWKEKDKIIGILKNQPFNIPTLKAGAEVQIKVSEIFDYIHKKPDGTSEGNETGALIEKYSEKK